MTPSTPTTASSTNRFEISISRRTLASVRAVAGLISCGTAAEAVLSSFSTAAAMETLVGGAAESVMTGFSTGATIEGGSAGAVTGTTMAGATAGGLAGSGRSDAGGASSLEFGTSAGTGDAGIGMSCHCK